MKCFILVLLMLISIMFSCQRIDKVSSVKGELRSIILQDVSAIPAEYGTLVSVTTHAQYEGWSQLWFVAEDSTIRMVRVQFHNNLINNNVLVIPRN